MGNSEDQFKKGSIVAAQAKVIGVSGPMTINRRGIFQFPMDTINQGLKKWEELWSSPHPQYVDMRCMHGWLWTSIPGIVEAATNFALWHLLSDKSATQVCAGACM